VRNAIDSRFTFRDHLVVEQRDDCDPPRMGGRFKARRKLKTLVAQHPVAA
jgi:hypothetical protein